MSSDASNKPFASVTGGVSPRPFASVEEDPPTWFKIEQEDPEFAGLDLAYLSAKEQEEMWGPDFYHRAQDAHTEFAQSNNKAPVIALTSGRYRYDLAGVPVWGAKLQCGTCKFFAVYDNWAQMIANLPDDCERRGKKLGPDDKLVRDPHSECPMYHGVMKRQYEARGS